MNAAAICDLEDIAPLTATVSICPSVPPINRGSIAVEKRPRAGDSTNATACPAYGPERGELFEAGRVGAGR